MSQQEIHWFWLWNGRCFGYRYGDHLFSPDGWQIGRFVGNRIFGQGGRYLGEVRAGEPEGDNCRLIAKPEDAGLHHDGFAPSLGQRLGLQPDRQALPLPPDCKRFPALSELTRQMRPPARAAEAAQKEPQRGTGRVVRRVFGAKQKSLRPSA